MDINIISFKGLDECFGHAGFGTSDRSETADESHILGKSSCFCGGITGQASPLR